jgi:NAD(P)-dependent dehydrogenase (short-subunit alcohol dehydrogenase family)
MTFERLENLNGQVAVITGANGGIGFAVAQQLAKSGAKIVGLVRRDVDGMQNRLNKIGQGHIALLADVTDSNQLNAVASQLLQCDILVNNAGSSTNVNHKNLNALTDDIFEQTIKVNLTGTFYVTRAFTPLLMKSPHALIVNISSASSIKTGGSNIAYAAAKAGVDSLTRNLAKALAPIRVVSINPTIIKTNFTNQSDSFYDNAATTFPLKRIVTVEDVASAVEALATTLRFNTGNNIVIDGGRTL